MAEIKLQTHNKEDMKQIKQAFNVVKKAMGYSFALSTLALSGALYPSFTQGQAATFITWFRNNILQSGWVAALAFVALFGGVVGMIMGETKGMKVAMGIMICIAAAFLGGDQIIALITAIKA